METVSATLYDRYRVLNKKGEGTFAEVLKCERISDGTPCAIKRMKATYNSSKHIDNLREVQALRRLNTHPNIVKLIEVIHDRKSRTLNLVFELMEMNVYERIRGRRHQLPEDLTKKYTYQLLKALDHMHKHGIFHRDVKPENILLRDDDVKLADLGSCRGIYSKQPFTEYISTRWYRAPECLLTNGHYGEKMDIWSVGCVMFEVMMLFPLFPGSNEIDQVAKIHDVLGTPSREIIDKICSESRNRRISFSPRNGKGLRTLMPQASDDLLDLLHGLLTYDPDERLSAKQALRHPYFKELRHADKKARARASQASILSDASRESSSRRTSGVHHTDQSSVMVSDPSADPMTSFLLGGPKAVMNPSAPETQAPEKPNPHRHARVRRRRHAPKAPQTKLNGSSTLPPIFSNGMTTMAGTSSKKKTTDKQVPRRDSRKFPVLKN